MSELDLLRGLSDQIVPPALDTLRETARRRTRRTATTASLVAALAVAVVIGGAQATLTDDHSAPPPADQLPSEPDGARPVTYAEGADVHYGDRNVTMADRVVELDLTDDGVVVRTADDRVWFTDGSAVDEISDIGESGGEDDESRNGDVLWGSYVGRVVTSNSGSEVAWYEYPRPHTPVAVVYDTEAGEVLDRYPVEVPSGVASGLYSVDSEAVYGFTDLTFGEALRPTWRIVLDTGTVKSMFDDGQYQSALRRRGLARTLLVSDRAGEAADFVPFDGVMELSVSGSRVSPASDDVRFVKDGLTGKDFEFSAPPGYPDTASLWLVQWLDDDTVVLQADQGDQTDLLTCQVSTGDCTLALEVASDAVVPEIG